MSDLTFSRRHWQSGAATALYGPDTTDPAPWYFRTLQTWVELLIGSGLTLAEMREPINPATGKPASIVFIASTAGPV